MPVIFVLSPVIQVLFAAHAIKTGRKAKYYAGAKTWRHYGLFLQKNGHTGQARKILQCIMDYAKGTPFSCRKNQTQRIKIAQQNQEQLP